MLKKRIIPVIQYRGMTAIVGRQFNPWRSVGAVRQQVNLYQARGVDELFLLDTEVGPSGREPNFDLISNLCSGCFMPMTVGGGMRTLDHFRMALLAGADKVAVGFDLAGNGVLLSGRLALISAAAEKHGRQAVTAIINHNEVCAVSSIVSFARTLAGAGAGEIVLNAIHRDGMMNGYELPVLAAVVQAVSIPVVPLGGAGEYDDFHQALGVGAHAVAAAAMFAFTGARPLEAAQFLASRGHPMRVGA